MNKTNPISSLLPLLLFLAFVFLAFIVFLIANRYLNTPTTSKAVSPQSLGRILSIKGQVMGQNPSQKNFENLDLNSPILQSQKIKTGTEGEVLIVFGDTFLLKPESSVFLILLGTQHQVKLLSGEIERYSRDKKTQFLVGSQLIHENLIQAKKNVDNSFYHHPVQKTPSNSPKQLHRSDNSQNNRGQAPTETKPTQSEQSGQKKTSSQNQPKIQKLLTKTFENISPFINKCFIKHYRRTKGQSRSGSILLSFSVEKGGFSEILVKESDYQDPSFHLCLKEVILRARVKSYKGDKIQIDFPLRFKLP